MNNSSCENATPSIDGVKNNEISIEAKNINNSPAAERNDVDSESESDCRPKGIIDNKIQEPNAPEEDNENENDEQFDEEDDNYLSEGDDSSDSDYSNFSGLSGMSGREWKPNNKSMSWLQKQINLGVNPRDLLSQLLSNGSGSVIGSGLNDSTLWRILANMLSEPPRRKKLEHVNTIENVVDLLRTSKNIIVLTGAGVSVSCGIPDFRSSDGIYSRLAKDFPDLPDPQSMFDINYFSRDPRPFFKFAREIYPGQFTPSPCHRFIKLLETKGKLLRNYTQNIDTLEQVAGIKNVIECHGSFSTASCTKCKFKATADDIRDDIFAQKIPICPRCQPHGAADDADNDNDRFKYQRMVENGIMKPDIVFFGEGLPDEFHTVMGSDKDKCDLLIVIGSSLKVRPVALIPSSIPAKVPQILINREQLKHLVFDVELLGDSDIIINQICHMLGEDWSSVCWKGNVLTESKQLRPTVEESDTQSVQSTASTDLAPTSLAFSDSGFESCASSFQPPTTKAEEFDCEDTCDQEEDTVSGSYPYDSLNSKYSSQLRHLSVDSCKDSVICDSSSNSVPPPLLSDTPTSRPNDDEHTLPSCSTNDTKEPSATSSTSKNKPQQPIGAADRLHDDTFYHHKSTSSYVFPGAQVSWSSDSEEEEDDDSCSPIFRKIYDEDDDEEDDVDYDESTSASGSGSQKHHSDNDEEGAPPTKKPRDLHNGNVK